MLCWDGSPLLAIIANPDQTRVLIWVRNDALEPRFRLDTACPKQRFAAPATLDIGPISHTHQAPQACARDSRKDRSAALRVSPAAISNSIFASRSLPARNRKSPLAAGSGA